MQSDALTTRLPCLGTSAQNPAVCVLEWGYFAFPWAGILLEGSQKDFYHHCPFSVSAHLRLPPSGSVVKNRFHLYSTFQPNILSRRHRGESCNRTFASQLILKLSPRCLRKAAQGRTRGKTTTPCSSLQVSHPHVNQGQLCLACQSYKRTQPAVVHLQAALHYLGRLH